MIVAETKSAEDTRELAAAVAMVAGPGDVVLLAGDLGSGKTTFAQGFGRAIGVSELVTSPTFTLVRTHRAGVRGIRSFLHADLYRLESLAEVADLGLAELLDEQSVALVEWGDLAAPVLASDYLLVSMEMAPGEDLRRLELTTVGGSWSSRLRRLGDALARWRPGGSPGAST